jgi:prevent-host-death family protein
MGGRTSPEIGPLDYTRAELVDTPAMKTVNIREARANLSKLVDEAAHGEPFVIAKDGKPMVKVTALATPVGTEIKRLGFMLGQISVPDDFDRMGEGDIERTF